MFIKLRLLAAVLIILSGASAAHAQATAGPEHAILKMHEGTWDCLVKPMGGGESKAVSVSKLEMGGLWLITDFKGSIGDFDFQGHGIDGYDPEKKKFVSVWIDSMTSAPMTLEGDYDAAKKTLTMTGEGKQPSGETMKFKNVTEFKDQDHITFTMSMVGPDGNAFPMMTIDYTRRK